MLMEHCFAHEMTLVNALNQTADTLKQQVFCSKVLVLRSEDCSVDAYTTLMHRLGKPVHHILEQFCLPQRREILLISNLYRNGQPVGVHEGGSYWHTDMSYKKLNTLFTSLYANRVPLEGGETEFIDCEAGLTLLRKAINTGHFGSSLAYLDLDSAIVVHRFGNRERLRDRNASIQTLDDLQKATINDVRHPLIVRHPVTRKESLYAVAGTSMLIEGFAEQQSHVFLNTMFDFLIKHAPRYVHQYQKGDIVIWDNLSSLHCGRTIEPSDNEDNCRLLYRINVSYLDREGVTSI